MVINKASVAIENFKRTLSICDPGESITVYSWYNKVAK